MVFFHIKLLKNKSVVSAIAFVLDSMEIYLLS